MVEYATLVSLSMGRVIGSALNNLVSNYRALLPIAAGAVVIILLIVALLKTPRV